MANYNSKASQILNWTANFLNGVSNAAREVVANPLADVAWLAAKWMMWIPNAISWWKINKAIDTVVSAAKWEQPHSLQKQPEDPTSLAYAAWEGLTRGIDQAAAVISLAEAARQLPKAAQKWWNKILNKVKDAKSKKQQMALAKEAREYINNYVDEVNEVDEVFRWEVPSYQQRRSAEFRNQYAHPHEEWIMETYRWVKEEPAWAMKTLDNITDEFANTKNSNIRSMVVDSKINPDAYRWWVYWPNSWIPMTVENNRTTLYPVNSSTTSDVNWSRFQQYRKRTYWDRLKQSNQAFLDAAPTPRSKAIRTDEVKRANDLWMTAEQLRDEAKKYWGSTQWYYEQRKALDELGVNNFNDYAKTMGLDWWTPNIYNVKEYNKIKNRVSL